MDSSQSYLHPKVSYSLFGGAEKSVERLQEDDMPSSPLSPQDKADDLYVPRTDDSAAEDDCVDDSESCATHAEDSSPVTCRKYIVWDSELDALFTRCRQCQAPVIQRHRREKGSLLTVTTVCENGHRLHWHLQPSYGRGNATCGSGTWLLSGAVLLSGGLFTTLTLFASILNLCFIKSSTFYDVQKRILCPVVNKVWTDNVLTLHIVLQDTTVNISGDGRCDSPGYSAKYGKLLLQAGSAHRHTHEIQVFLGHIIGKFEDFSRILLLVPEFQLYLAVCDLQ